MRKELIHGDCIEKMRLEPDGIAQLVFADPPFNISFSYRGEYDDDMPYDDYIHWSSQWLAECVRLLSPTGSIYVAICDEFAAELTMILKGMGLHFRNTIIWHYTFGQATSKKFARCHTQILYFTKSASNFTFNADDVRIPSARQLKYKDKRANPKGCVPPDVWTVSRICGTFKAKAKGAAPCQMPEQILDRIIIASSNPGDLVLDPFAGTGSTAKVADALGRGYLTIEKSKAFYDAILDSLPKVEGTIDNPIVVHPGTDELVRVQQRFGSFDARVSVAG